MAPADFKGTRMQRNSAPMPLNLVNNESHDNVDPMSVNQPRIDDLPVPQKPQTNRVNHSLFSSNFNFAAGHLAGPLLA